MDSNFAWAESVQITNTVTVELEGGDILEFLRDENSPMAGLFWSHHDATNGSQSVAKAEELASTPTRTSALTMPELPLVSASSIMSVQEHAPRSQVGDSHAGHPPSTQSVSTLFSSDSEIFLRRVADVKHRFRRQPDADPVSDSGESLTLSFDHGELPGQPGQPGPFAHLSIDKEPTAPHTLDRDEHQRI